MSEKMQKIIFAIGAVVLVAAIVLWMILNPGPEHIEDTNGSDNYALQQITEADVLECKMGNRGGPNTAEAHWDFGPLNVSSGMEYSSHKYTGVYRLYSATIFKGSDIYVYLGDFHINSGNFAFYVVFDGEIVGQVQPDEFGLADFTMENIDKTGTVEYIIAGESADFRFIAPVEW